MNYIIYGIILVAAVIGLTEIVSWVERKIVFGKQRLNIISVVPLSGKIENVELVVRNAVSNVRWNKAAKDARVILLDMGMDHETERICHMICSDINNVSVYTQEELKQEIPQLFEPLAFNG